jgi:hypothetical protein
MAEIDSVIPGQVNPDDTTSKNFKSFGSTTNPVYALNKVVEESYTENTEQKGTIFKTAICLKVVNSFASGRIDETSKLSTYDRQKNSVTGQEASAPLEIICMIPGRDSLLPTISKLPNQAGNGGDSNISFYPSYLAIGPELPTPKPGDLVRVRIDDSESPSSPRWYLGLDERNKVPVKSAPEKPSAALAARCRGQFCGEQFSGEDLERYNETLAWKNEIILKDSIDVSTDRGAIPRGKGVITGFPSLANHPVSLAQDVNLSWVAFNAIIADNGYDISASENPSSANTEHVLNTGNEDDMKKFTKEYHKNGIKTYILGVPRHGSESKFINKIIELADLAKPIGIIIDFSYYIPPRTNLTSIKIRNDALNFYTNLYTGAKQKGFSVGITISDILEKGNLPWKEFAGKFIKPDFIMPQISANSAQQKVNDGTLKDLQPGDDGLPNNDLISETGAARKQEFIKTFDIFKKFGYKNIIPALGMFGTEPPADTPGRANRAGWAYYNFNSGARSREKPPLASRYDIKWAFESLSDNLSKPNAIVWYDWKNIDFHSSKWAEKRWDLIKELGDAEAVAEKFNLLDQSSVNFQTKNLIKARRLDIYLNDTVEQFKTFINQTQKYVNRDNSFIPNKKTIDAIDPFAEYALLTKEEKEGMEKDLSTLLIQMEQNEETIVTFSKALSAMGVALSNKGLQSLYDCLDKSEEELNSEINAAAEALRQAQEYQDYLKGLTKNKQEALKAQELNEGPKQKKPTAACLEETVPDVNPRTGLSNSDAKKGGSPNRQRWPRSLEKVNWDRFADGGESSWLVRKWSRRVGTNTQGLTENKARDHETKVKTKYTPTERSIKNNIAMFAAAEILERYWKQVFATHKDVSKVEVKITSNWRPHRKQGSQHYHAAAIDYDVRYTLKGEGEKAVPHLYQWAINTYLMGNKAKRLPKGCVGMYLNQNIPSTAAAGGYTREETEFSAGEKYKGVDGLAFSRQGSVVRGAAPTYKAPGGSAGGPHYDIRGFLGNTTNSKSYYIFINTTAKSKSDDVGYSRTKRKETAERFGLKNGRVTDVSKQFLKKFNPEVYNFIMSYAEKSNLDPPNFPGWPYDLVEANEYVPNWNQLLGLEPWDDELLVASSR